MLTMRCIFLFQPISLGIFRSDYLIDKSDGLNRCSDYFGEVTPKPANGSISIKQVEMNTISLGGITFSCFVPKMHRYSSEGGVRPARIQILSNSATIFSYYFSSRYCWFFLWCLDESKTKFATEKSSYICGGLVWSSEGPIVLYLDTRNIQISGF